MIFQPFVFLEVSLNTRYPEPGNSGKVHHHYQSGKEMMGQERSKKKNLPGLHLIIPFLVESDKFTALSPSHCSAYIFPDHLPFHSLLY